MIIHLRNLFLLKMIHPVFRTIIYPSSYLFSPKNQNSDGKWKRILLLNGEEFFLTNIFYLLLTNYIRKWKKILGKYHLGLLKFDSDKTSLSSFLHWVFLCVYTYNINRDCESREKLTYSKRKWISLVPSFNNK